MIKRMSLLTVKQFRAGRKKDQENRYCLRDDQKVSGCGLIFNIVTDVAKDPVVVSRC
jgi:hypothetical protein